MNSADTLTLSQAFQGRTFQHALVRDISQQPARRVTMLVPNFMGIGPDAVELAREFVLPDSDVFIVDVYGGRRPSNHDEAGVLSQATRADPRTLTHQIRLAIEAYLERQFFGLSSVSLLGFCFGGAVALELARTGLPLHAVVALHADLSTRWSANEIKHESRILTIQGSADPLVPLSQINAFHQEMSRFQVEWRMTLLGGLYHAFTDPHANVSGVAQFNPAGRRHSFDQAREFMA